MIPLGSARNPQANARWPGGPATKGNDSMKQLALLTGILALAAPLALAQPSTWTTDSAHSEVDFTVRHLSISNVHGRFGKVTATMIYNDTDVSKSSVKATIDVTTLSTGETPRDTHLKTPDFFEVEKFPTATFTSTSVARDGSNLKVSGDLTVHGVTKPVVLDVDGPTSPVQGMDKKLHSGFSASTTINRTDFGIGSKFPDAVVSDKVTLTIDLDFAKQ
jgi:polyisoprenoid-binding protein YceI